MRNTKRRTDGRKVSGQVEVGVCVGWGDIGVVHMP